MRVLSLVAALLLTGCSSLTLTPKNHAASAPVSEPRVLESIAEDDAWNGSSVLSEGKATLVLITPEALPETIRNKKISIELEPGATITDVVATLGRLGVAVILADKEVAKKDFYLPRYTGTLGGLLSAISRATDVWFTWHDGTVVASQKERIAVTIPQEEKFGEVLSKGLDSLGIKDSTSVTWQAGMAVMEITPSQFRKVKSYLERLTANAAVISLQLAVVNVSLKQDAKVGIDWQSLQLSATRGGSNVDLKNWERYNTAATPSLVQQVPSPGTTVGTGVAATPVAPSTSVSALGFAGGALTGAIFSEHFNFNGMFNFLQTYGTAETKQNVVLKTVAGNKVELKSLTSVPYVSEVGLTNTTGTTNTSTGSTKTSKADDGLTVEMVPTYDAAANSVTVDMKLSIKAVVAFNELSAGNQIGKLTQPTTAERSFNDIMRLRPGQTVVVGGITYDTYSNNKAAPIFLSGSKLESDSLSVNRQTMFIVLRPTVMKLGQLLTEESGDSLELLPPGTAAVEPPQAKTRSNRK